ncbi:MAG: POTRA domain-containing protein, partial [Pseudomonadota bacterium]
MLFRPALLLACAVICAAPSAGQSVELRGEALTGEMRSELAGELPDAKPAETRFEARRQADRAAQRLGNYLNSQGYFAAGVEPGVATGPPPEPYLTIEPGPRFTLSSASIAYVDGDVEAPAHEAAEAAIELEAGAAITPKAVLGAESRIVKALQAEGHAYAEAVPRQVIGNRDAATIAVTFKIDPGPRVVLGEVEYGESLRIRRRALDVLVPFKPGTPYTPKLLDEFNQRLGATRLFEVFNAQLASTPSAITEDGAEVCNVVLTLIER